jgi:hypothetical protein
MDDQQVLGRVTADHHEGHPGVIALDPHQPRIQPSSAATTTGSPAASIAAKACALRPVASAGQPAQPHRSRLWSIDLVPRPLTRSRSAAARQGTFDPGWTSRVG